jgi:hypothetical protein
MRGANEQLMRICLFPGSDHARAAISDLMQAGVPPDSIIVIGGSGNSATTANGMKTLKITRKDARFLANCTERGEIVVATFPSAAYSDKMDALFVQFQAAHGGVTATYEHGAPDNDLRNLQWCPIFGCP